LHLRWADYFLCIAVDDTAAQHGCKAAAPGEGARQHAKPEQFIKESEMQHTAPTSRYLPDLAVRSPVRLPVRPVARLWQAMCAVTKRLQHGRMISVLMRLSDAQLARIGIARAGIPAYARRLVYDDANLAPGTEDPR
jgi:uncharacterized protein YjiS (DUF1127 family)